MKKTIKHILLKSLRHLPLLTLVFILNGCYCTSYIDNLGKTKPEFRIKQIFEDPEQNIICEAKFSRKSLNHYDLKEDIGTRFLILNAISTKKILKKEVKELSLYEVKAEMIFRWVSENKIQLIVNINYFPKTEEEAKISNKWYVYPLDIINKIENPNMPKYLISNETDNVQYKYSGSHLPCTIDGKTYDIDIVFHSEEIYQEKWEYPLKVLYVPAVALDIVAFPFAFVFLNYFCHF
ncbi:MAG: hypothetical protein WC637_02095 [Victivallales bacterium]|jgi:hypothetical protein